MKKQQVITTGITDCPDCGERAACKTIQHCDVAGNLEPGYYLVIDCDSCEYYTFEYVGPDN